QTVNNAQCFSIVGNAFIIFYSYLSSSCAPSYLQNARQVTIVVPGQLRNGRALASPHYIKRLSALFWRHPPKKTRDKSELSLNHYLKNSLSYRGLAYKLAMRGIFLS
ncbi:MAG: hypothetical protein OSA23_15600, partial [Rhodospirillales bacterium]|nr:hypothetical protein [Rhodospirillales bacterium]